MKKLTYLSFLFLASFTSFGQGKNIYDVTWVKPKPDQVSTFEAALKAHVQKFHKADHAMYVSEVLTGEYTGHYQMVRGPHSWAEMDSMSPNPAHDADWEKTVAPLVEKESGRFLYRYVDSTSYNDRTPVEKVRLQFLQFKGTTDMSKVLDYYKKLKELLTKNNDPRAFSVFSLLLPGSKPEIVFEYQYKAWSQLEMGTFPDVKAMYEKEYGQRAWDEYRKFIDDAIVEVSAYLDKSRADLSTPVK